MKTKVLNVLGAIVVGLAFIACPAFAADKKPNILIIWGDDIGGFNISAYNQGMMGYKTPNIDRLANEGALFTDWYGQQSCTAGRAAFITGQSPIRTGLTKVGMPGSKLGLQPEDPTIAELLKPLGYVCGQFGKNHLGDLNELMLCSAIAGAEMAMGDVGIPLTPGSGIAAACEYWRQTAPALKPRTLPA